MSKTITLEVSESALVDEVGYAILGRAQDIHENPDDEYEHHANELKRLGQNILDE